MSVFNMLIAFIATCWHFSFYLHNNVSYSNKFPTDDFFPNLRNQIWDSAYLLNTYTLRAMYVFGQRNNEYALVDQARPAWILIGVVAGIIVGQVILPLLAFLLFYYLLSSFGLISYNLAMGISEIVLDILQKFLLIENPTMAVVNYFFYVMLGLIAVLLLDIFDVDIKNTETWKIMSIWIRRMHSFMCLFKLRLESYPETLSFSLGLILCLFSVSKDRPVRVATTGRRSGSLKLYLLYSHPLTGIERILVLESTALRPGKRRPENDNAFAIDYYPFQADGKEATIINVILMVSTSEF